MLNRKFVGVVTGLATAATLLTPALASSAATTSVSPMFSVPTRHAGVIMDYTVHGNTQQVWMGSYNVVENGVPVIADCMTPLLNLVAPTKGVKGIYGSKRQSAEISYIMDNEGDSSSSTVAAGGRLAMLNVLNRTKEYPGLVVSAKIAAFAKADVANAVKFAGPATAQVRFGDEPTTPGQRGSAGFYVTSAKGHNVPGIPVRFTAARAAIRASGKSGAQQTFTREATAPVKVSGSAKVSSDAVLIGTSGSRLDQTLVSSVSSVVTASGTYQNHASRAQHTVECNCDGTATVTATFYQAAGADEGRYTLFADGKADGSVTIPVSKHGISGSFQPAHAVADGATVTFTASYKVNGKWTAPVAIGGSFTVICPVLPSFSVTCNCNVVITDANPFTAASGYEEFVNYTVGGVPHSVAIPARESKAVKFTVKPGQAVTYYSAVQRNGKTVVKSAVGSWS